MKLGFVTAILDQEDFKEVVDTAVSIGYECLEVACWPVEKASRRYAGVTHIDIENLNERKIQEIKAYCTEKNIEISALAYYPNMLTENPEKRNCYIKHLKKYDLCRTQTRRTYDYNFYRKNADKDYRRKSY